MDKLISTIKATYPQKKLICTFCPQVAVDNQTYGKPIKQERNRRFRILSTYPQASTTTTINQILYAKDDMRYYAHQPDMTEKQSPYQIGGIEIPVISDEDYVNSVVASQRLKVLPASDEPVLEFFVPGPARAKQSFRYTGRGHGFTLARIKSWQADVGWSALQAIHHSKRPDLLDILPLKGDVAVDLIFLLGTNRRIDADNLSKAVLDALNDIVWKDDKQAIDLHPRKFIVPSEESGVYVIVREAVPDLDLLADIRRRIQAFKKESEL